MSLTNPWLTAYQRSFESIRTELVKGLRASIPEMTDYTEGNVFVVIISAFAAIAETIHYYIDNMAREAFLPTARRYSSVFKHAKQVDYHIKAAVPASVDLILSKADGEAFSQAITIPAGRTFTANNGSIWMTEKAYIIPAGIYSKRISVVQKEYSGNILLGNVPSTVQPGFQLAITSVPQNQMLVEGSMTITIGGQRYDQVDTFAYSGPEDRVFKVEFNELQEPYLQFGDGVNGNVLDSGNVYGSFYYTEGSIKNLQAGSLDTTISLGGVSITVVQKEAAAGGTDYETFDNLKEHIPLSIMTLGVAITRDDYEAIAKLVPGVHKAYVDYKCGKYVDIYVTPEGGIVASQALLDSVTNELNKHKVITTSIQVNSTQAAYIYLAAEITGKKSYTTESIQDSVIKALVENYNQEKSDINQPVRLSDLYHLIDALPEVDYLAIKALYFYPNVVPTENAEAEIDIFTEFIQNTITREPRVLEIYLDENNPDTYKVLDQNTEYSSDLQYDVLQTFNTPDGFSVSMNISTDVQHHLYTSEKYLVTVEAMDGDITPIDFAIPIFIQSNIDLTIHETV